MPVTDSLQTENVVASTEIDQEVALDQLAEDLTDVKYDPDHFPGLVYRVTDPSATALIFRSGKLVCTGANSVTAVERAVEQTFVRLKEIGLTVPNDVDLTVQNIVTSGDLGEPLNLNAIAIGLGLENVEYEPEQFPGLVYRLPSHDVVALLFGSGKVVITGGTEPADAANAIETIRTELADLELLAV